MPGVPTGRGCDACRKQKKKCNQTKPACSRCTRLAIECVGSGQRRFKFVNDHSVVSKSTSERMTLRASKAKSPQIGSIPSNEMTLLTSAFCYTLEITDARYDLSVYGPFLKKIPGRLGSSRALDTSVRALTVAFTAMQCQRRSPEVLKRYVEALKALRVSLNDPGEVGSANTLCAVYLIMICQGWLEEQADCMGHGEAIVHLLRNSASRGWHDGFKAELLVPLCVTLIFEAFTNTKVKLGIWFENLTRAHDETIPVESLKLGNLAKLPCFMHDTGSHLEEMEMAYYQLIIDISNVKQSLTAISLQSYTPNTMHAQLIAAYGILLTFAIILNTLLQTCNFEVGRREEESTALVGEVIPIAREGLQYRPLGSSFMPICIVSALAATKDECRNIELENVLTLYQSDFASAKWKEVALWLMHNLQKNQPLVPPARQ